MIYARVDSGVIAEIIPPVFDENGTEIPIEQRFAETFVSNLVDVTSVAGVKVGWVCDNGAVSAPTGPTLAQAQAAQLSAIDSAYGDAVLQPVSYKTAAGTTQNFDADLDSQRVLMQSTQGYMLAGSVPEGFYWVAADNTHVPFTLTDLQGLYQAMLAQGWAAFQKRQNLKAEIAAATSVSAVQSITW
ncbi:DUF4376 domain-containing protein [Burkholderia cepacia]|uniref:DUF4376 domain-containing protein n=1 Tax=Burkholderia cepacia TaxID=292 RepID=UPI001CF41B56|nr:DUF4376 domain-containing protein [Burkholderia cepacia]MCA8120422.1 DUF4376 domain-containing protein [Burkholderia cepacia]